MIAVGVSTGAHCPPCLPFHLSKARAGVSESDIQPAMDVGFMVEKGAERAMREYAGEVVNPSRPQAEPCCSGGESTCCDQGGQE
ncbi:MAG: carboxymuconolactone decarboxylase family protein [Nitrospiraceae bacterium]|nr:carboxymuconolactone decarboxylase family protein [Nitrospiraceae bacterium]